MADASKSNQSNDDWNRNVFRRRPKVSRDDARDQTGKTTAISVTMLITKTVYEGFGGRWLLLLPCMLCWSCWIGTRGGRSSALTPQTKIFSHQCGGHLQPVGKLTPSQPHGQIECCSRSIYFMLQWSASSLTAVVNSQLPLSATTDRSLSVLHTCIFVFRSALANLIITYIHLYRAQYSTGCPSWLPIEDRVTCAVGISDQKFIN